MSSEAWMEHPWSSFNWNYFIKHIIQCIYLVNIKYLIYLRIFPFYVQYILHASAYYKVFYGFLGRCTSR